MAIKGFRYIFVALGVGLIAVFAIHRTISMKTQVAKQPMGQLVVAEADVTSGTVLNGRLVKVAKWPQDIIPASAIRSVDQMEGRVVVFPLSKGEPVLLSKLAPEGTAAGLGGLLKPQMRAFTVKVDDVSGVAGFIHPGDNVDVLMSMPVLDSKRGEEISKIILQDIKVLTSGQVWQPNANNEPKSVNTVTLEVTADQSEILNLASTQGKIRLTLRSRVNKDISPTRGVVTSFLVSGHKEAGKDVGPQQAEKKLMVDVIKGMDRSMAKF